MSNKGKPEVKKAEVPQQVPATHVEAQIINTLATYRHATILELQAAMQVGGAIYSPRNSRLIDNLFKATQCQGNAMQMHQRFEQIIQQQKMMEAQAASIAAAEKEKADALETAKAQEVGADAVAQLGQITAESAEALKN